MRASRSRSAERASRSEGESSRHASRVRSSLPAATSALHRASCAIRDELSRNRPVIRSGDNPLARIPGISKVSAVPHTLATRLDVVQPSVTLAMNARAAELRAKGVDVFAFGVGEPDFEPPAQVLEAAKKALDTSVSKYTAVTGIPALKQAICARTTAVRGWTPKPSQVTVAIGAKHALFNLALALYETGDEVIIPAPYWVSYPEQVKLVRRRARRRPDRRGERLQDVARGLREGVHAAARRRSSSARRRTRPAPRTARASSVRSSTSGRRRTRGSSSTRSTPTSSTTASSPSPPRRSSATTRPRWSAS